MMQISPDQWEPAQIRMMVSMVSNAERAKELGRMAAAVPQGATIEYLAESQMVDLRPELSKITAPLLTIAAIPTDQISPEAAATMREKWKQLFARAPKLTFVRFEHTRHFVMDDRPHELDSAIADFLGGREVKGIEASPPMPTTSPGE
jgi:pimeloyl-ACP methyl ester carboxylesterase